MTKKNTLQTLKGFRDFMGIDAQRRLWLQDKIRKTFSQYGFEPLESPTLEYESLLAGKYGEEGDRLMYRFEDRGGRKVAMRYDQTVPTARIIAQYQNQLSFPYKRYQIQPVWRADKPQKGRYREFLQCDADIIGSTSSISDAEILSIYYAIYINIGLDSIVLKVNDRKQLIKTIQEEDIDDDMIVSVIQTIDKLEKKGKKSVIQELSDKGIDSRIGTDLLKRLEVSKPSDNLKTIIDQAVSLGVPDSVLQFSPILARGLDYYTGMIFEGVIPEYTVGSVGGGGRYDNLINQLVGVDIPAVGFGLGFDRTLEAAVQLGKIPDFTLGAKVFVTIFSAKTESKSLEITRQLRQAGITTECVFENDLKMNKQLKYADRKGIPYVIIIGPEEIEKKVVVLKDMNSGKQELLSIKKVINTLV